jgi:hypothetical protein
MNHEVTVSEMKSSFDRQFAEEELYGAAVIFRHDDDEPDEFWTCNKGWSSERSDAFVFRSVDDAAAHCEEFGISLFGHADPIRATCDVLRFATPDALENWLGEI